MPIPQLFFHIVTYFMFTGSEIIAPEINQESNLNLQQDERFIIYARNYMQPCFADYVPNQTEIAGSFTVGMWLRVSMTGTGWHLCPVTT